MNTQTQNKHSQWVPAIPEPYYGLRKRCTEMDTLYPHLKCWGKFWTLEGYRAHYALKHILGL